MAQPHAWPLGIRNAQWPMLAWPQSQSLASPFSLQASLATLADKCLHGHDIGRANINKRTSSACREVPVLANSFARWVRTVLRLTPA